MITKFEDRRQAGRVLGFLLAEYRKSNHAIVLALAGGGVPVGYEVARALSVPLDVFDHETGEVPSAGRRHRSGFELPSIKGNAVILVDDGLATGASMMAAVHAVRPLCPESIVVAVPVAAPEACRELSRTADKTVCATTPQPFSSVREWYRRFEQTSDEEVQSLLRKARLERMPESVVEPRAALYG